ncbi:unnamed protein product [Symbiodinium natans]|uniref:Uncharacterized protein n=1 Tax=Symbiodinium natans TaxID=878477 RepID=A0A812S2A5_9DINO|nr:unnamed protein product [Symbiodinium natans]
MGEDLDRSIMTGFPWQPASGYLPGESMEGRRYPNGETYPAWHEIDGMIAAMPAGTRLSFHLNNTKECPYVSALLRGDPEMLRLIDELCSKYRARHIQVNISARGLPTELFTPGEVWEKSSQHLVELAERHPETLFLIPIFQRLLPDSTSADSWPFMQRLLQASSERSSGKPAGNLVAFFDNSAGSGKVPDAVPEIPADYPREVAQPIGFTGGISASNVQDWLSRYSAAAAAHGCKCISDAQSGFREGRDRGKPIDVGALKGLVQSVYQWGTSGA